MDKDKLKKIIGDNIRKERQAKNMSIDELAELMELTNGFVGLIERGRRGATAHNLLKFSSIFGKSIDYFFTADDASLVTLNETKDPLKTKRNKISLLISDFSDKELNYLLNIIKGLRDMRNIEKSKKDMDNSDE